MRGVVEGQVVPAAAARPAAEKHFLGVRDLVTVSPDGPVPRCGAVLVSTDAASPHRPRVRMLVVGLLLGAVVVLQPVTNAAAEIVCPALTASTATSQQLQDLKTCQEARKLEIDNSRNASWLGAVLAVAPFVTALVAVAAFAAGFWKQQNDKSRQARQDLGQRALEVQSRFDGQFAAATANLGSESTGLQAAGASSLLRLQRGDNADFQLEIILFCSAQLRIGVAERVRRIVTEVLEKALRATLSPDGSAGRLGELSLADAEAPRLDLAGLKMRNIHVDLSGAKLQGAHLREADLWKVTAESVDLSGADCAKTNFGPALLNGSTCRRTDFSGGKFSSSKWRGADLSGSTFVGASLQSADFRGATLQGVRFDHADLNDAYFATAVIDQATYASIRGVGNWRKAHFDAAQLRVLEAGGSN